MNDTILALLWTTLGGVIVKIIESILKRGESRTTEELAKDKMEYEQSQQMRQELRQEIKELRDRLAESDKRGQDLAHKVALLEAENVKKDIRIVLLEAETVHLQKELDKFNRKVYYKREDKPTNDPR